MCNIYTSGREVQVVLIESRLCLLKGLSAFLSGSGDAVLLASDLTAPQMASKTSPKSDSGLPFT